MIKNILLMLALITACSHLEREQKELDKSIERRESIKAI